MKKYIEFPGNHFKCKNYLLITLLNLSKNDLKNKNSSAFRSLFNDQKNEKKCGSIYWYGNVKAKVWNFGSEFGLWKNTQNYELTALASKLKRNRIDLKKFFDVILFNFVTEISSDTYNPLIIVLEYCKKYEINEINEETLKNSFKECEYLSENEYEKYIEKTFWINFIYLLEHTSYLKLKEESENSYLITEKIKNLLIKCNYKYHKKKSSLYKRLTETEKSLYLTTINTIKNQKIYYGAPGTGKSYKLKEESENYFCDENIKRITFHPSYSYSNFVGSYKPKKEGNKTVFDFVPGPLINILIEAYEKPDENYLLIIEEINRANVSEVFGDFFQLIERDENGRSQYDISASEDLKDYLEKNKKGSLNPDELCFPENLYIWATMNSSDQGTFPLDTAFKRRWDFEYIGIDDNEEEVEEVYFKLPGDDEKVKWNSFRKSINKILLDINSTINEDKLLGPFFIGGNLNDNDPEDNTEIIKNKVVPYLYEDVLKYLGREAMKEIFNLYPKNKEYSNKTLSEIIQKLDEEKFEDIFSGKIKILYEEYEREREKKKINIIKNHKVKNVDAYYYKFRLLTKINNEHYKKFI